MKKRTLTTLALVGFSVAVYASSKAPEKSHGIKPVVAHQNALEAQIGSMSGYDIRGRTITFAPGAASSEHSHAERPGMVYVISGTVIEHRNGERLEYSAGDTWIETADTNHWIENPTNEISQIFMVDLPVQK